MKIFSILFLGMVLISVTTVKAETLSSINKIDDSLAKCLDDFTKQSKECSETWSMKCYNFLTDLHHKTRECYKDVGIKVLREYYNLSDKEAKERLNQYGDYIYNSYLFIYNNNEYCLQNNCGVSPYLYSEYATTEAMRDYISTMIKAVYSGR